METAAITKSELKINVAASLEVCVINDSSPVMLESGDEWVMFRS